MHGLAPSAQHALKLLKRSGIPSALRLFIDLHVAIAIEGREEPVVMCVCAF